MPGKRHVRPTRTERNPMTEPTPPSPGLQALRDANADEAAKQAHAFVDAYMDDEDPFGTRHVVILRPKSEGAGDGEMFVSAIGSLLEERGRNKQQLANAEEDRAHWHERAMRAEAANIAAVVAPGATHEGRDPGHGGIAQHRGPREKCPAPECLDRLAEQHSETHRETEISINTTGHVYERTVYAGDWEDTGMRACPFETDCALQPHHDGGLFHPGRGTAAEQDEAHQAWAGVAAQGGAPA